MLRGMKTQDVSKKGLKYGDEDEDEAEKKELEAQKIAFAPLIDWLKKELSGQISDGEILPNANTDYSDPDKPPRHFALHDRRGLFRLVGQYGQDHVCPSGCGE